MISDVPEPEPEIYSQSTEPKFCYWNLNVFDYIIVCWSVGILWGFLGSFTARTIITRRGRGDEEMVVAVARPIS